MGKKTFWVRDYWVLPFDSEFPLWQKPANIDERTQMMNFWREIADLERHEDTLLNNRMQGFLIVTSLLLAAFSQFREKIFFWYALAVATAGIVISLVAFHLLRRTAELIQWYLGALLRLDEQLFSKDLQPYLTQRISRGVVVKGNGGKVTRPPASAVQGVWLPLIVLGVWFFLALTLLVTR